MSEPVIEIDALSFAWPGQKLNILENASLQVEPSDFFGFVGPNGGGKSTLLKLILGLIEPKSGSIRVLGKSPRKARAEVGYVPQFSSFRKSFPLTVHKMIATGLVGNGLGWGSHQIRKNKIAEVMEKTRLNSLAQENLTELSGGQVQRCLIARALVNSPKILLLDEPTSSIDPMAEEDIYVLLEEINKSTAVILVSHDMHFVSSRVKKLACINKKVFVHDVNELGVPTLESLYGHRVKNVTHNHSGH